MVVRRTRRHAVGLVNEHEQPMSAPKVSIIVEWENARLSEGGRPAAMLRAVGQQAIELAAKLDLYPQLSPHLAGARPLCELLIVFDNTRSGDENPTPLVERSIAGAADVVRWRLVPVNDSGYYSKKHHGVMAADGGGRPDCRHSGEPGADLQCRRGADHDRGGVRGV